MAAGGEPDRLPAALLVDRLADLVISAPRLHVSRVAVDGPDAAGKTTLAGRLADAIEARGRPVVRASVDGFHHPRARRRCRGDLSPEGYYDDAFDYPALRRELLDPLGPGGDRRYRAAVFDLRGDVPRKEPPVQADRSAVLVLDGVFLLRPDLADAWDLAIRLEVSPGEAVARALVRDADLLGGPDAVRDRYRRRYLPAQDLYRRVARPHERAHIVVDHDDPAWPRVIRWAPPV